METADDPLPLWRVLLEELRHLRRGGAGLDDTELSNLGAADCENLPILFSAVHSWSAKPAGSGGSAGSGADAATATAPLTALCFSGGGIRSATFNLGILQGLAKLGLLERFDYLSSVSGGGYISSWLARWIHTRQGCVRAVQEELKADPPRDPVTPEPPQVAYLRRYSNYLTPRLGMLSADTWTLISIGLRNILLNWLVLVPLLTAPLLVPLLAVASWPPPRDDTWEWLLFAACALEAIGLFFVSWFREAGKGEGEGKRRRRPWFLGLGLLPRLAALPLLLTGVHLYVSSHPKPSWSGVLLPCAVWSIGLPLLAFWASAPLLARRLSALVWDSCAWVMAGALETAMLAGFLARVVPDLVNGRYPLYAILGPALVLGPMLLGRTLFVAISSVAEHWEDDSRRTRHDSQSSQGQEGRETQDHGDADREWWARWSAWALICGVVWTAGSALVLLAPSLLASGWAAAAAMVSAGGSGALIALLGKSAATPAKDEPKDGKRESLPVKLLLGVAMPLFIVALVLCLSTGAQHLLAAMRTDSEAKKNPWPPAADKDRTSQGLRVAASVQLEVTAAAVPSPASRSAGASRSTPSGTPGALGGPSAPGAPGAPHGLGAHGTLGAPGAPHGPGAPSAPGASGVPHGPGAAGAPGAPGATTLPVPAPVPALNASFRFKAAQPVSAWHYIAPYGASVGGRAETELAAIVALLALGFLAGYPVNINRFSMQAGYRNRLIRAYLGASNVKRRPNLFTGFDAKDNVLLRDLESNRPFPVINMTLNLVRGQDLAWQERKAESFTATPLHCGAARLGYRPTADYGGRGGLTLGTAVATSGAAANPNMGFNSSPAITFIMTLFSVRLGAWMGNPGAAGSAPAARIGGWLRSGPAKRLENGEPPRVARLLDRLETTKAARWLAPYKRSGPRFSARELLAEAFGWTDESHPYVSLSDGGHFEDLGLYEMVRRRCHVILVCDAGADPGYGFKDLGNAIRKIRIDFGIPIVFRDRLYILPKKASGQAASKEARYCAVADILYSAADKKADDKTADKKAADEKAADEKAAEVPDGILIYVKPSICEHPPPATPFDVANYARFSADFPHETTADQWFSETQFESYRALGEDAVMAMAQRTPCKDLDDFVGRVKNVYLREAKASGEARPPAGGPAASPES